MYNFKDLTGQKFGKLTVLYRGEDYITPNGRRETRWWCQCDCGSDIILVKSSHLKQGNTKSCGCLRKKHICNTVNENKIKRSQISEQMIGQKFGKLLVLYRDDDYVSKGGFHIRRYRCKCDCGNEVTIRSDYLRNGKSQSCGCILSRGEYIVSSILCDNNIEFEYHKTFDTCRFENTNALAEFDFYVNSKYIIEFDGMQHFIPSPTGWNTLEKCNETKEHDKYKNQWCKNNNIPLIRIPYYMIDKLSIKDLCLETSTFLL